MAWLCTEACWLVSSTETGERRTCALELTRRPRQLRLDLVRTECKWICIGLLCRSKVLATLAISRLNGRKKTWTHRTSLQVSSPTSSSRGLDAVPYIVLVRRGHALLRNRWNAVFTCTVIQVPRSVGTKMRFSP
jgi:hypothetical protein